MNKYEQVLKKIEQDIAKAAGIRNETQRPIKRRKALLSAINNNPENHNPKSLEDALTPRCWMIDALFIKERVILSMATKRFGLRSIRKDTIAKQQARDVVNLTDYLLGLSNPFSKSAANSNAENYLRDRGVF